jgi:integrase
MPRKAAGLTARQVQTHKAPGLFADGGGLYLQVAATGAKTWIFRFQIAGRRRDMGLGSVGVFTLAEARQKAADARRLAAEGVDPIEHRAGHAAASALAAAKAMTFKACADQYISSHQAGWRSPKSLTAWEGTLGAYVHPVFGALPVQAVDVGLVMKAIEPIWTTKPETAGRVRGRIESILDWATTRGYRTGDNPARWRGHLENLLPKRSKVRRIEHHAALAYPEIGDFMVDLRQQDGVAACALEFAILTAARTGEVIGARWDEISIAERLWTIPGERMKAGKEHRVPLSDAALAILDKLGAIRQSDHVFPGGKSGRPLSNMSMLMLLRRMGRGDLTIHGFRSSFRDWAAERTAFPAEVAEMALAHAVADKVEAAYRRGDLFEKRRQLAEAWARFCDAPPLAGRVVPMRQAASPK